MKTIYLIPIMLLLSLSIVLALPVCTNANIQVNVTRNGISTPLSATLDLGVYGWVTNTTTALVNYYTKTQVDTIITSENSNNTGSYYLKNNPNNYYNITNLTADQYVKNQTSANLTNITATSINVSSGITNNNVTTYTEYYNPLSMNQTIIFKSGYRSVNIIGQLMSNSTSGAGSTSFIFDNRFDNSKFPSNYTFASISTTGTFSNIKNYSQAIFIPLTLNGFYNANPTSFNIWVYNIQDSRFTDGSFSIEDLVSPTDNFPQNYYGHFKYWGNGNPVNNFTFYKIDSATNVNTTLSWLTITYYK